MDWPFAANKGRHFHHFARRWDPWRAWKTWIWARSWELYHLLWREAATGVTEGACQMSHKRKFVTKSADSNIITRWYKRWTVPTVITIVVTACYYPTFRTCFSRSLPFHGSSIHITIPVDNQDNQVLLLMEEILHQLIGSLFHYLQWFIHPRWCSPDFFHQQ